MKGKSLKTNSNYLFHKTVSPERGHSLSLTEKDEVIISDSAIINKNKINQSEASLLLNHSYSLSFQSFL